MPSACRRTDAEPYVVRHNPPTYFPDLRGCRTHDLPMGTTSGGRLVNMLADGRLPALTVVIPNQCHNTHDCDIPVGDAWLSELVPQILDGPDYAAGRTALFVTYDEGAGGTAGQSCRRDFDESCHIVTVAVAPSVVPGTRSGDAVRPLQPAEDDRADARAQACSATPPTTGLEDCARASASESRSTSRFEPIRATVVRMEWLLRLS